MLEQLIQIIAVSISQMALIFFKYVNVRVIVAEQVLKAMLLTFALQAFWLISSAIGINAFIGGDWVVVAFYLVAGVFGTWLNFKMKV